MFLKYLISLLLPIICYTQTATFYADSTDLYDMTGMRKEVYNRVLQAEWKIKGKTLHYGSKPLKVGVDNKIDTIFYRQDKNSKWHTLVCNINKADNFRFLYNPCCGGFNTQNTSGNITGKVKFSVTGKEKENTYLGVLDDAAVILSDSDLELSPYCRSAMHPNVYNISIQKIKYCKDESNCNEKCINNGAEIISYIPISQKTSFLFLPLSDEPFVIIYDLKKEKYKWGSNLKTQKK
ncbi:hypothetical protein GCM10007424_08220 [Flavobacterium suaedae]|uniref:DUF4450 domain-containing protein n=1 Tax=Flavobacterium suaedae TaxID=1767027 RepID=A0ABQ1JKH2_9FLAO|nr:hypothetical protein [Flavobacterium suaedae]GGB70612.1 hypothetical protein GCM10007424_08220 [Flavobacterium suaedae]